MTFAHRFGVVVLVALTLAGCSGPGTAPAPSPTDTPPEPAASAELPELIDEEWDVVVTREFPSDSGPSTCTAHVRVDGKDDDSEAARAFLVAGDWDSVEVSLDDYETRDLEQRRARGASDAGLLLELVTARMTRDLTDAGLFTPTISLENQVRCE